MYKVRSEEGKPNLHFVLDRTQQLKILEAFCGLLARQMQIGNRNPDSNDKDTYNQALRGLRVENLKSFERFMDEAVPGTYGLTEHVTATRLDVEDIDSFKLPDAFKARPREETFKGEARTLVSRNVRRKRLAIAAYAKLVSPKVGSLKKAYVKAAEAVAAAGLNEMVTKELFRVNAVTSEHVKDWVQLADKLSQKEPDGVGYLEMLKWDGDPQHLVRFATGGRIDRNPFQK